MAKRTKPVKTSDTLSANPQKRKKPMIKRLTPDDEATDAKQPKAIDGLQFDTDDGSDDNFANIGGTTAPPASANSNTATTTNTSTNTSTNITINTAPAAAPGMVPGMGLAQPGMVGGMAQPGMAGGMVGGMTPGVSGMAQPGMMGGVTMTAAPPPPLAPAAAPGTQSFGGATAAGGSVTASTEYEVAGPITNAIGASDLGAIADIDKNVVHRKMLLEEARFKLEEERERHRMMMELRKEQFREDELRRDEEKEDNKEGEHWMKSYWRPAMGWLYMLICAFDFVIAPMLSMAMPLYLKYLGAATVAYTQWQSLTLANGGLIHLAFGAILGVTAWTRGQEKIAKMG